MECFSILLAVCPSLALAPLEPVRFTSDHDNACLPACWRLGLTLSHLSLTLEPAPFANDAGEILADSAVLPDLALSGEPNIAVFPLGRRVSHGATGFDPGSALPPVATVKAMGARRGVPLERGPGWRIVATCNTGQCTLVLLDRAGKKPIALIHGGRNGVGEMGGRFDAGRWVCATGRVSFDRGNRLLVHMQDVDVGEIRALGGRLAIGGIARSTFRYFDTRDVSGLSLSSESGPVLGVHPRGSSHALSTSVTAGPDVFLTGRVSGTMTLGLRFAH
ncbi:MAG: hypothetical protein JW751_20435 [Polyangiaceae bacterium]|nr:hypothetical protein [Polyangiaceae bacterium]